MNHNLTQDILFLGLLSFVAILILNLCGKLILPIFSVTKLKLPYFNFFIESLIGFVAITTVYSILLFGIYTIHLVAFLFFIFLLINKLVVKKEKIFYRVEKYNLKSLVFIPAIPFISIVLSLLLPYSKGIQSDISFYCKIAESFTLIDKENFFHFFNFHGKEFNGTVPYHYIEMHFGSLLFKLFSWSGYTNLIIFKYVVYNSLKSLVIIGLISIIEKFKKPSAFEFVLMLFIICIDFVFITDFNASSYPLYTSMWMRPNFIIYYLFLIALLYYLYDKNLKMVGPISLLFVVSTAVVAPPLFVAMSLLMLWVVYRKNEQRDNAIKVLLGAILLAITIAVFYKLTGAGSNVSGAYSLTVKGIIQKSLSIWKAIVGFSIILSIRLLILLVVAFIPIIFLGKKALVSYFKANSIFIAFIFLLPFCGILIFQAFAHLDNMYQFPYVGYVGVYLLFIFNIFYALSKEKSKNQHSILLSAIILLLIVGVYAKIRDVNKCIYPTSSVTKMELKVFGLSDTNVNQLASVFNKNSGLKGGTILDKRDIIDEYMGYRQSLTAQVGFYLMYLQDNTNIELLSEPTDLYPDTNYATKEYLKAKGFNKLTTFYKNYNSDSSYIYNLKKYLTENEFSYLVLSKQVNIKNLGDIKYVKYIKDYAGYQFLILK